MIHDSWFSSWLLDPASGNWSAETISCEPLAVCFGEGSLSGVTFALRLAFKRKRLAMGDFLSRWGGQHPRSAFVSLERALHGSTLLLMLLRECPGKKKLQLFGAQLRAILELEFYAFEASKVPRLCLWLKVSELIDSLNAPSYPNQFHSDSCSHLINLELLERFELNLCKMYRMYSVYTAPIYWYYWHMILLYKDNSFLMSLMILRRSLKRIGCDTDLWLSDWA